MRLQPACMSRKPRYDRVLGRDGVLEDCPRPRGHLEDKKIVALALALASMPCPLESGLHSPVTCSLSIITAVACCFVIDRFMCNVEPLNLAF